MLPERSCDTSMTTTLARRDVRPTNTLRGADDCVRLSGFGCAALVTDAEAMRGFCGCANYVSPEMAPPGRRGATA